ncbi:MAG: hypothetical protein ACYTXC_01835 [Nostoc sp.]
MGEGETLREQVGGAAQRTGLSTQAKPTFPCGTLRERGLRILDFG